MHYLGWIGGSLLGTLLGAITGWILGLYGGHQLANYISQRPRHDTPDI